MLFDILIAVAALYALVILLMTASVALGRWGSDRSYRPAVSIIIAARNEESNIAACLDSVDALTYPAALTEVIVVDDQSTDRTGVIIEEYVRRNPHFRLLPAKPSTGRLHGKVNAIAQGMEIARGEVVLFTDADCVVPTSWVEDTVKYYADRKVGLVAGFTLLEGSTVFARMQALDWFALFSVASAAARIGAPLTAVGTNLTVRRKAYQDVGGYEHIPFSVTEDYALFHAIAAGTANKVRFPMDPGTLVTSAPCHTWAELYHQKKRWFRGGRGMDLKSLLVFAVAYALNLLLLVAPFVVSSPYLWVPYALKVGVDFLLPLPSLALFRQWRVLVSFPLYEIYYFLYVLLYPPLVEFGGKIVWKERSYGRGSVG